MTAAHDYGDLHHLVDRLTPDQAREPRNHALRLVEEEQEGPTAEVRSVPRDLSFVGIIHAEPDLAERSVVAIAERLGVDEIATLDRRHFSVVRPRHAEVFSIVP